MSSMIVSDQITREQALEELQLPLYEEEYMDKVKQLICEKLEITLDELEAMVAAEGKQHTEYRTEILVPAMKKIYHFFR